MTKRIVIFFTLITLTACSSHHIKDRRSNADLELSRLAIVADPQIHNIHGNSLKQMLAFSDVVSKVALRPAELNILAPLALESLVAKSIDPSDNDNLVIVLGDGTNVGCANEYDEFENAMSRGLSKKGVWLMAHGNHDSYMMGTTNGYVVAREIVEKALQDEANSFWPPKVLGDNNLPADVSWWNHKKHPSGNLNWRDSCYKYSDQADKFSPMNKLRWMSRYLAHIEASIYGASIKGVKDNKASTIDFNAYRIHMPEADLLGERKLSIKGMWFEPIYTFNESDEIRIPDHVYTKTAFTSYLVQSVELNSSSRILIIDTSVCRNARLGLHIWFENAGTNACIGSEQMADIEYFLEKNKENGVRTIIAAHFPYKDLTKSDREQLKGLFKRYAIDSENKWTYLSAHSHTPTKSIEHENVKELNFGSTTDWPMQSASIFIGKDRLVDWRVHFFNKALLSESYSYPDIVYKNQRPGVLDDAEPELCRHVSAARLLAGFDPQNNKGWESPPADESCLKALASYNPQNNGSNPWKDYSLELEGHIESIKTKMSNEDYKTAMVRIAATASRAESNSFSIFE